MEQESWYLEVLRFAENGAHIPLACYGPLTLEAADRLLVEYSVHALPLLDRASGVENASHQTGKHCCGIVNRKRYEVMIRPDFFVCENGISGARLGV